MHFHIYGVYFLNRGIFIDSIFDDMKMEKQFYILNIPDF